MVLPKLLHKVAVVTHVFMVKKSIDQYYNLIQVLNAEYYSMQMSNCHYLKIPFFFFFKPCNTDSIKQVFIQVLNAEYYSMLISSCHCLTIQKFF